MPKEIQKYQCLSCTKEFSSRLEAERCENIHAQDSASKFLISVGDVKRYGLPPNISRKQFDELVIDGINAQRNSLVHAGNRPYRYDAKHTCKSAMFDHSRYNCPACEYQVQEGFRRGAG